MALVDIDFYSHVLGMDTQALVLLPEKRGTAAKKTGGKKYPVLYLLHGHSDDHTAFIRKSGVELLARERELIVVMPNGHRSFYVNGREGLRFFDFITEELPVKVDNFFHPSGRREDTFIAGFSMGGYGALKAALGKPEKYAAVAVLSCVADPVALGQGGFSAEVTSPADMTGNITRIFGGAEKFYGSDNDLAALLRGLDKTDGPKPAVFQCCGAEDFLLSQNRDLNSLFSREIKTIHHTYREGPGGHNWAYWNRALPGVFEFFGFPDKSPLTEA